MGKIEKSFLSQQDIDSVSKIQDNPVAVEKETSDSVSIDTYLLTSSMSPHDLKALARLEKRIDRVFSRFETRLTRQEKRTLRQAQTHQVQAERITAQH